MAAGLHWFREGVAGRIVLDRQDVLNALDLAMVRACAEGLDAFERDPAVRAVTIEGRGERAFCAGGDVLAFYDARGTDSTVGADFFREEYTLNRRIKRYPKPVVAFMDGITMGGGVGLSVHASHRVVDGTHDVRDAGDRDRAVSGRRDRARPEPAAGRIRRVDCPDREPPARGRLPGHRHRHARTGRGVLGDGCRRGHQRHGK